MLKPIQIQALSLITRLKRYFSDYRIVAGSLYTPIKIIIFGILLVEAWRLSQMVAFKINPYITSHINEYYVLAIGGVLFVLLVVYLFVGFLWKALASKRADILISLCFGIGINVVWGGFFINWYSKIIASLNVPQLLIILSIPFVLCVLLNGRFIFNKFFKKKQAESRFIPDIELKKGGEDLLNFREKANSFAEYVFNNGAPESFVFGIDAPWGIGKSTFTNFCIEHWEDKELKNKVIVYKFSPLRYVGRADLFEIFVDGLIKTIRKESFIPEIEPLISRYARLLKGINSLFSILGINIPAFTNNYTADDAFDDLSSVLEHYDKKIVIIVDDLDRIEFSEIKQVLFVIRKSFALPNISYVLCYDTDNITALEAESKDIEKVSEFLEKFINIKISLFLDRNDLKKYVDENLHLSLPDKSVDPMLVHIPIGGLLDIFSNPKIYHEYQPFIGDVRKLKRLINTTMLFEWHGIDFKNSDFDKRDLVNLLLIYIHYPNIFRKIYDSEMNGGYGFFSAVTNYDDGFPEDKKKNSASESTFENSTYYSEYIKTLPENGRQRFLLDQVFNVNKRLKLADIRSYHNKDSFRMDEVPEEIKTKLACFNGGVFTGTGRNLDAYLELIANLKKPEITTQHSFYVSWKNEIVNGSVIIEKVFMEDVFSYDKGEQIREKLFRVLVNSARGFDKKVSSALITYLLDNTYHYSLLEISTIGTGLRHDMDYFLTRLLNDSGWADKAGKHSNNTTENIEEIARWIFGEGEHAGNGVLEKLSHPDRGVLGLNDLMTFRLFCSADRGGDIFDLTRSLSKHGDEKAPTEGNTGIIAREEMREISQRVFNIFKSQYIDTNENIFDEVEDLTLEQLAGSYKDYVEDQIKKGIVQKGDVDKEIASLKTRIVSFIIYQLGNDFISSGVGCGFYDPDGKKDEHKIKEAVNDYLFNFCFNPTKGDKNFEHFLDYLFRNFASVFASSREDGREYIPSINEFTKALDKIKLATYWQTHGVAIKAKNFHEQDKVVFVGNYSASYKKELQAVYKVLDDHVQEVEKVARAVASGDQIVAIPASE